MLEWGILFQSTLIKSNDKQYVTLYPKRIISNKIKYNTIKNINHKERLLWFSVILQIVFDLRHFTL